MSDEFCDLQDVTSAASELAAFACSIGATQLYNSSLQLQFSSIVSSFANEIIQAVDDGLISARQGLQKIRDEYEALFVNASFYVQNGIGIVAGAMQVQTGVSMLGTSGGLNVFGGVYLAHGVNNIYEGFGNIYNGPQAPAVVGPIRQTYQLFAGNEKTGNIVYYSVDLSLSVIAIMNQVRKENSVEFFVRDPLNYERAYNQMSSPSLVLEALIDALTIKTTVDEFNK